MCILIKILYGIIKGAYTPCKTDLKIMLILCIYEYIISIAMNKLKIFTYFISITMNKLGISYE